MRLRRSWTSTALMRMAGSTGFLKKGSLWLNMPKETDIILNRCMGLKEKDSVLIITDSKLRKIADGFLESASKITDKAELEEIPIAEVSGQEPPEDIARDMLNYSVIILVTTKSLSHTNARKNASKNGARIASLPTVTEDIRSEEHT